MQYGANYSQRCRANQATPPSNADMGIGVQMPPARFAKGCAFANRAARFLASGRGLLCRRNILERKRLVEILAESQRRGPAEVSCGELLQNEVN